MKKFFFNTLCAFSIAGFTTLSGNPTGDTLIAGSDFSVSYPDSSTCEISASSARTIVEWESFNIGVGQTTTIYLPDSSSAMLNRVTTAEVPTLILGNLNSNGQVYLINPSGIAISSNAVINTNTFLASTLDADNSEFLNAGDMTFIGLEDPNAFVYNDGTINAEGGDIFLLSYQVTNSSTASLTAENGAVALGAGVEIVLSPTSEQRIAIVAHAPLLSPTSTGVDDSSYINAITAELKAQGNLYATAINHAGWIDSQHSSNGAHIRVTGDGGYVLATGLMVSSNGSTGGVIDIMGQDIEINTPGIFDVTSPTGQGVINVGQDVNGNNSDFVLAQNISVDGGYFNASTDYSGDGGQVAIRSDNSLSFAGSVDAIGGALGGNGGLVVFDTNGSYSFDGNVDVSAPVGEPGVFIHP